MLADCDTFNYSQNAWLSGRTFHALSDTGKILAKLEEVAGELSADLTDGGWTGKTITLKYKLDTFQGTPAPFVPEVWYL